MDTSEETALVRNNSLHDESLEELADDLLHDGHRCCCGVLPNPGGNRRRKYGALATLLMGWAALSGVLRGSPAAMRWFARIAVGWVTRKHTDCGTQVACDW